jgi:protein involved in polysaccharide export with SLBB domain
MNSHRMILVVAVLFAAVSGKAFSQVDQSSLLSATSIATTTSNYYFAKPNELTIIVNIMGFVQRPGRYEISSTIDLVNLLALAGGPQPDGSLNDVKISRLVKVSENRFERKELRINLENLAKTSSAELVLQPGDVIEIERTGWANFRDVFSVVISAAVLTSAVASVISLTRSTK